MVAAGNCTVVLYAVPHLPLTALFLSGWHHSRKGSRLADVFFYKFVYLYELFKSSVIYTN